MNIEVRYLLSGKSNWRLKVHILEKKWLVVSHSTYTFKSNKLKKLITVAIKKNKSGKRSDNDLPKKISRNPGQLAGLNKTAGMFITNEKMDI